MSSSSASSSTFSQIFCGCFLIIWVLPTVVKSSELPWIRLTHDNFSSEIHTHPFLLCLATVPWCGESRSLMRELSKSLSIDESLHSLIQLRVVYLNVDKDLQIFFLQSAKHASLTFFWHSNPLKYKGKLRLQNILTAINHAIKLSYPKFPFKKLRTAVEVENFMGSTDKAVILFDFCNYRNKIQESKDQFQVGNSMIAPQSSEGNDNMEQARTGRFVKVSKTHLIPEMLDTEQRVSNSGGDALEFSVEHSAVQEFVEENSTVMTRDSDALHGMLPDGITKDNEGLPSDSVSQILAINEDNVQDRVISCKPELEFTSLNVPGFSWGKKSIGEYKSKKSWSESSIRSGVMIQGEVCNRTEFRHFAKVYQQLVKIAMDYILTPEHTNFGVVEDKSLLSTWGIVRFQNHTWFLMQWMADWPNLPRLYNKNESLQMFLYGQNQLVNELSQKSIISNPSICNSTIAVVLFIDKASLVPKVCRESWEAISALRAFAREHARRDSFGMQARTSMELPIESNLSHESDHPKSVIEIQMPNGKETNLKSTFSEDVMQEQTDQPTRDRKSLSDEKPSLLSHSFANDRDFVFKLLLEDNGKQNIDANPLKEDLLQVDFGKLLLSQNSAIFELREGKHLEEADSASLSDIQENLRSLLSSSNVGSFVGLKMANLGEKPKETSLQNEIMKIQVIEKANRGRTFSFYFVDGEDQWKEMAHPALPYPSLIILDPFKGEKFVFPTLDHSLNYTSLKSFFKQFLASKLEKVSLSEVADWKPRKHVEPPFVNRDFHEVDGVPRVHARRLQQLLVQRSLVLLEPIQNKHEFWERATLVLFTAPSCGFCKRMELVFREVHRLFMCRLDWKLRESSMRDSQSSDNENMCMVGESRLGINAQGIDYRRPPHLFQIDCLMNDCGDFFESIEQDELYPTLILYPAQGKEHPVMFEGLPTVQEILKFVSVEGEVGTRILSVHQGIQNKRSEMNTHLQTGTCPSQFSQSIAFGSRSSSFRHSYQFKADRPEITPSFLQSDDSNHQESFKPIIYPTVGSVLLATEKLSKASEAFQNSKILIIKADGQEGFQGLITNKPLAWNRLGLAIELEALVNRTTLFYGGPVILEGEPFLSLSRLKDIDGFSEVVPHVYAGGPAATKHVFQSIKAGRLEAADFWFFLGHAIWGWQQLLNEIEQHYWNLTSLEEGVIRVPIYEWLQGSTVNVADLLERE